MWLAKRLVLNTTTEAGREGATRQLGSVWLCVCLAFPWFSLSMLHCLGSSTFPMKVAPLQGVTFIWIVYCWHGNLRISCFGLMGTSPSLTGHASRRGHSVGSHLPLAERQHVPGWTHFNLRVDFTAAAAVPAWRRHSTPLLLPESRPGFIFEYHRDPG